MKKVPTGQLIFAMLRNPKATLRLLNPERINNFFITYFKQPAYVRKDIIRRYLALYDSHSNAENEDRRLLRLIPFSELDQVTALVVDHCVPEFDQDAGSRSTLQYLQLLVNHGAHVKFLPDDFQRREPYTSMLEQLGIEVLYGDWYRANWKRWWKENADLVNTVYLHRPNIAHRYIETFKCPGNAKIVYFGHDLHYLRVERQYSLERRAALQREAKRWKDLEFRIIERSNVVYFPSMVEVGMVKKNFPEKHVRVLPLFICEPVSQSVPRFDDRSGILFVGGLRHPPNVDGVKWFVHEVLPLVSKNLPEMQCVIAGSRMPDEVFALANEQIIIKGWVSEDELTKLYGQVRIAVVPLRFGAGMKGKVLEAMQHRVPVVTTSIGAEGLPHPLDYIAVADEAQAFAGRVVEVYTDSAKWLELSEKGAEMINAHFSEDRALEAVRADFGL